MNLQTPSMGGRLLLPGEVPRVSSAALTWGGGVTAACVLPLHMPLEELAGTVAALGVGS